MELLIEAGCFDSFNHHRDDLKLSLDAFYDQVQREQKEASQGVISLFAKIETAKEPKVAESPTKRLKEDLLIREKELLGFFLSGHPLDAQQETLKLLSSVPLSQAEDLPLESIFRSSFIIEEVATRISSKSQKKFAILRISDGGAGKYELPIWPEMYEELQSILVENRLVWAVLAKEARDNSWQLSCKWMGELKRLDEAQVALSDAAFDKAKKQKEQRARIAANKKPGSPEKKKKEEGPKKEAVQKKAVLKIDLLRLRASHILHLQRLIACYPGDLPLEISFIANEQEHSSLTRDASKGIHLHDDLKLELSALPSFLHLEITNY
jgi:DNA polymerase-3 subunit alpha